MKKLIILLLSAVAVCCSAIAISACNLISDTDEINSFHARFSDGELNLEWKSSGGKYEIYRSEEADGDYELIDVTKKTTYSTPNYSFFYVVKSIKDGKIVSQTQPYCYMDIFGDNVHLFAADADEEEIQSLIDKTYKRLIWDEFSERREAFMFMPGSYEKVTARIGYYTGFYGLGYSPEDVTLKGFCTEQNPLTGNCLVNFWRSAENFTVNEDALWCVSQATSLRRMNFKGSLALDDGGYSSGGFLADSVVAGNVTNRTQQQWFSRNSSWDKWTKTDINMVFSGVQGTVTDTWPNPRNTVLDKTAVMKEKPFLVFDEMKGFGVFVPELKRQTKGVSWKNGTAGQFISIENFYIADAKTDNAASINAALAEGKHILFTPGIYRIEKPVYIGMGDTVLLGLGYATLQTTTANTDCCLRIGDVAGVSVSGILIDAGSECKTLMQVGESVHCNANDTDDPICLSDVFFRLGGARYRNDKGELEQRKVGADVTLEINADNVIGDNFWMWRADHGMSADVLEPYTDADGGLLEGAAAKVNWAFWKNYSVGWKGEKYSNYGKNGVVVNGDNVTVYGLMVEHYGEYQTIWNGENGFMCFYQSETPYDAPDQSAWKNDGKNGYASYKVAEHVTTHTANGIGVYYVCNGIGIKLDNAVEAPDATGITMFHLAVANFKTNDGNGINSIINGKGKGVFASGAKTSFTSFIGGVYKE